MWSNAARVWRLWFIPATVFMILVVSALAAFSAVAALTPSSHDLNPAGAFLPTGTAQAAGLSVNLDQCANFPLGSPCTWQNGNLNKNNSGYTMKTWVTQQHHLLTHFLFLNCMHSTPPIALSKDAYVECL